MARGIPELEEAVRAALKPTSIEIVRAKKAIRELLADGEPCGIRRIQACLLNADGIPLAPAHGERLQLASAENIDSVATPSHPLIARTRLALAATEALIDLHSQGLVIEMANPPDQSERNPIVGKSMVSVPYEMGAIGRTVQSPTYLPNLAKAYRLAPRLREEAAHWFSDPDLFTTDIEDLALDPRARRCLVEALTAFRGGLFLACASLLGAASEGAWYAAGEQFRGLDDQLDKALDADNTAKVITRVAEVLRQDRRTRSAVDDLRSQAALFRQLRNYGVHPRGNQSDHLERYFTETGAGILLMETHTYLTRLSDAVRWRLGGAEDSDSG